MSRNKSRKGEPSTRLLRVGESVRHVVSAVIARGDIQDEDLKGVSITVSEVRVSPDLRHAKAFVMALGGDTDDTVLKALNRNAAYIRGQMAKSLTMKYTPELKFLKDDSFDEASHIETLLKDPKVAKDLTTED